jgi:tetratricopeptide (TPR) repeat protein
VVWCVAACGVLWGVLSCPDALGDAKSALQQDPQNAQAYARLGEALFGLDNNDGAVEALAKATALGGELRTLRSCLPPTNGMARLYGTGGEEVVISLAHAVSLPR